MYNWNVTALKAELKRGSLSESDAFRYVLASSILMTLELALVASVPPSNVCDYVSIPVAGLITIAGTVYCHRKNGGAGGVNFLSRYVSLGWVSFVRWLVLGFVPLIVVVAVIRLLRSSG